MGKEMMKRFMKGFPIFVLITMLIGIGMGSAANAQEQAFWTNDADVGFVNNQVALTGDQTQVIRVRADVPDGQSLQAYNFTVTYDPTVVEVVKTDKLPPTLFVNDDTPGKIIFNGFETDADKYKGPVTVSLLDVTIKGVANGSTTFDIGVNKFGDGSTQFELTPVPLFVTSANVPLGPHQVYWINQDGRFSGDELTLPNVGDQQTIQLAAEIPDGKTLKAFKFTLKYDPAKVQVTNPAAVAGSVFAPNTSVNHIAADGIIIFNGFDETGVSSADAVPLLQLTVTGLAESTSEFGITVNNFGQEDTPVDEFKPLPMPLTIIVGQAPPENKTYFVDAGGNKITQLPLNVDEEATIRLVAEVPDGETLRAYNFSLDYNSAVIDIVSVNDDLIFEAANTNTNTAQAGEIITNGFDTAGVGAGTHAILAITVKGKAEGVSPFNITVESFGTDAANQFKPTPENLIINVGGAPGQFIITATTGAGGTIMPSGEVPVTAGANVTFIINPNSNYKVNTVTVDGSSAALTGGNQYTFYNVAANHAIHVTFKYEAPTDQYKITATAGENGTILPAGEIWVDEGANQTFTVTPNEGFVVDTVTVDGEAAMLTDGQYTFTGVVAEHTINVTFKEIAEEYTITATAGENGAIDPAGEVVVAGGEDQTFTFNPVEGYVVADVVIDGTSYGSFSEFTFEDVSADHTIEVTFRPLEPIEEYTITATAGDGGTIDPAGEVPVVKGEDQTFTIAANEGFIIADVVVDGQSLGSLAAFTFENVTADHTIAATFAEAAHTITATAGDGGAIDPAGEVMVADGASQTFTITVNEGFRVLDVLVDGESVGKVKTYTFNNVTADHTIAVTFEEGVAYTITATAGDGGAIDPAGEVTVAEGESQTFTITANEGFRVLDVLVDGESEGKVETYTFENVTADHTIAVTFEPIGETYTITATAGANGSISPAGAVVVAEGADQIFRFYPNTNYQVADVMVDGTSVGIRSSYTFTNVSADHTISVSFSLVVQPIYYTITATSGTNGSISPSGTVSVIEGGNQTFNFVPNTGYEVANVTVDGASQGVLPSYTFTSVFADHTISVTFTEICEAVAAFTATVEGSVVTFDTAGSVGTLSFDYGDGATGTETTHIYDAVGTYTVTLTATGADGCTATATRVVNIVAKPKFTVTVTAGANGTITPSGVIEVEEGGSLTFTVTPNAGYEVNTVLVDGSPVTVNAAGQFTVTDITKDITVNATFKAKPVETYTITADAGDNGGIYPMGQISVAKGVDMRFVFMPDPGYQVDNVTVDGVSQGVISSYTFSDVSADHTIGVTFKKRGNYITDDNGTLIPTDKEVDDPAQYFPDGTGGASLIMTCDNAGAVAVSPESSYVSLTELDSICAMGIPTPTGQALPIGLISSVFALESCGSTFEVTMLLSDPVAAEDNPIWYQYDRADNQIMDYSDHATFNDDDGDGYYESVTLEFQDGGYGDLDGEVNCELTDLSGYGVDIARAFTVTQLGDLAVEFEANPISVERGKCFTWNFGDGSEDTSCVETSEDGLHSVVTHTYAKAGTYTVTLAVMGTNGAQSLTQNVKVTIGGDEDGGGDNCFISTVTHDSRTNGNTVLVLMLMAFVGATAVFFLKKVQR